MSCYVAVIDAVHEEVNQVLHNEIEDNNLYVRNYNFGQVAFCNRAVVSHLGDDAWQYDKAESKPRP